MNIVVTHSKHWHHDRPRDDGIGEKWLMHGDEKTTVQLDPPAFKAMVDNWALGKRGVEVPTEDDMQDLLCDLMRSLVHEHHAPQEHWTSISVEGEPGIEAFLRQAWTDGRMDPARTA